MMTLDYEPNRRAHARRWPLLVAITLAVAACIVAIELLPSAPSPLPLPPPPPIAATTTPTGPLTDPNEELRSWAEQRDMTPPPYLLRPVDGW
jgi:hypothetical protein